MVAGRGGIGWLLDRFSAARVLAAVCLAVSVSLLLFVYAHGKVPDALAALQLGSVLGAEVEFTAFLVRRCFGNAAFSRLYGMAFGIFALSIGIGPLVVGRTVDNTGGYNPGLLFFVALSLFAAFSTYAMPPIPRPDEVSLWT